MTITWSGVEFVGPYRMDAYSLPKSSGVYAIMSQTQPNTYKILYFGESGNFEERITAFHHRYDCWKRQAGSISNMYFGLHQMTSTINERLTLEAWLIQKHSPICNY
jgi:excinuclease UvrABC nuclease subunit